ncbi:MAG: hypothetical protein Q8R20_01365 [Nanoarchaeota archaeon]|nr:hypothetical protein [Nanoarchaeota archaeon]
MPPEELEKIVKRIKPAQVFEICKTSKKVLRKTMLRASRLTLHDTIICITGSLYLVGEARSIIKS